MIRILAIGNSFSQDATHYLNQIAAADSTEILIANLYIGGCSLERHLNNIRTDAKEYLLEINGRSTERYVSVSEALAMEDWDYLITQQVSGDSGLIDTYEPALTEILAFLRAQKPDAGILLHETWAYETDALHPDFLKYGSDQRRMYEMLSGAYRAQARKHGLRLIPCGDAVQQARSREPFLYGYGGMSLCRDGFHMNLIYGRYLLAAVWYRFFTGRKIAGNPYRPHTELAPNAVCDEGVLRAVQDAVDAYFDGARDAE